MNRYRKLFSDTVIFALGTFGSKLLVFLLMPLYTSLLSPEEYGTAELITGAASLLIPVACVGITNGIFRFVAERGSDKQEVFSSGIALLGAGLTATVLIGIPVLIFFPYRYETLLVILYVIFADIQAVCAQYVRATDRTRLFAVQGIFNTGVTVLFNLIFLMIFHLGVTGYVLATIAGNLCTILLLILTAKLHRAFSPRKIRKETVVELLKFSIPMVPTTVCWLITDLSDRYMVTWFCGSVENGIYSASYRIPSVVNLLSGVFMQAWQFSAVTQSSDREECGKFYSEVFRGFLSVVFIGTGGLILFSRLLTRIMLNAAYYEAWRYMPTLLCAAALEAIVSFLATVYLIRKKTMHSFLTAMTGSVLNIVLNLFLIPRLGALGAAVATMISYAAVLILRLWDAPRLLTFRRYLPRQLASILLLCGAAAAMTVDPPGRLWICAGCVALIGAVNFPALLSGMRDLLAFRSKKPKKDEEI